MYHNSGTYIHNAVMPNYTFTDQVTRELLSIWKHLSAVTKIIISVSSTKRHSTHYVIYVSINTSSFHYFAMNRANGRHRCKVNSIQSTLCQTRKYVTACFFLIRFCAKVNIKLIMQPI